MAMTDSAEPDILMDYSEAKLREEYRKRSRSARPDLSLIYAELSRRSDERSRRSIDRLTKWLTVLTAALVILGFGPGFLTVHDVAPSVHDLIAAFTARPSFTAKANSYYCVTPDSGPCTIAVIYQSTGGPGTAVATYSVDTTDGMQTCEAVIPSTPKGSDVAAFCVVRGLVEENPDIKTVP
jgi:hypothetical protein